MLTRFLILCLLPFYLSAQHHTLSLDSISNSNSWDQHLGQEVELQGFLHSTSDGRYYLSSQANLRTCCIGKTENVGKQVHLLGAFEEHSSSQLLTIQGVLDKEESNDEHGKILYLYCVHNVRVLESDYTPLYWGLCGAIVVLTILFVSRKIKIRS